jgi:DNA-binding NtrC family response regulator
MTSKGRILICDDTLEFSKGIKRLLLMEGYEVVTRSNPMKSIQCLEEDQREPKLRDRFSVVVVDLDFDDKEGPDAGMKILEVARRDPLLESIVCTSKGDERLAVKAINLGVFGYVMKNEPSNDLLQTVCRASALHNQCLGLIEEIERLAQLNPGIAGINALSPHIVDYVRNIRGRGK